MIKIPTDSISKSRMIKIPTDSISKSRMINNLIDITRIRYKKCESNNYSTNRAESYCDDVTKYNNYSTNRAESYCDDVTKYNNYSTNIIALYKHCGMMGIIGDSILYGIDESGLKCSKVRVYPEASVDDMFFNIFPLLRKNPTNIIMHAGTNNAVTENSAKSYWSWNMLLLRYSRIAK